MERQPKQSEWLNSRDRQKLIKAVMDRANWFRAQLAAAPRSMRETYIPLLATGSILMHDDIEPLERDHLRRILAIQADILTEIPDGIGGISELHQYIGSEAEFERQQWQQLDPDDKLPQPWKNAKKDSAGLAELIAAAEGGE